MKIGKNSFIRKEAGNVALKTFIQVTYPFDVFLVNFKKHDSLPPKKYPVIKVIVFRLLYQGHEVLLIIKKNKVSLKRLFLPLSDCSHSYLSKELG